MRGSLGVNPQNVIDGPQVVVKFIKFINSSQKFKNAAVPYEDLFKQAKKK